MDICKEIAMARQSINDREQAERDAMAERFVKVIADLRGKLDSLREAHRIFRELQSNGFGIYDENMHMNREQHYKKGYFISDGWFHWPGFSKRVRDVFFTCGGGFNRFSCGIELNGGSVVYCTGEFGIPTDFISNKSVIKMIKDGKYYRPQKLQQGKNFDLKGSEILEKLKYCLDNADEFVSKVHEFAEKVVKQNIKKEA